MMMMTSESRAKAKRVERHESSDFFGIEQQIGRLVLEFLDLRPSRYAKVWETKPEYYFDEYTGEEETEVGCYVDSRVAWEFCLEKNMALAYRLYEENEEFMGENDEVDVRLMVDETFRERMKLEQKCKLTQECIQQFKMDELEQLNSSFLKVLVDAEQSLFENGCEPRDSRFYVTYEKVETNYSR